MKDLYNILASFVPVKYIRPHLYDINLFLKNFSIYINNKYEKISILDFGAGKSPYKKLFKESFNYISYDKYHDMSSKADLIFDSDTIINLDDNSVDVIMAIQVLEHLKEPSIIFSEFKRILKPNGYLLITTHQNFEIHCEPEDYFRFTFFGLKYLGEKNNFIIKNYTFTNGFIVTLLYGFVSFLKKIFPNSYFLIFIIFAPVFIPLVFTHYFLFKNSHKIPNNPINLNIIFKSND